MVERDSRPPVSNSRILKTVDKLIHVIDFRKCYPLYIVRTKTIKIICVIRDSSTDRVSGYGCLNSPLLTLKGEKTDDQLRAFRRLRLQRLSTERDSRCCLANKNQTTRIGWAIFALKSIKNSISSPYMRDENNGPRKNCNTKNVQNIK